VTGLSQSRVKKPLPGIRATMRELPGDQFDATHRVTLQGAAASTKLDPVARDPVL